MSLLPFGVAMLLRYVGVSSRAVFSGVGIYLLVIWSAAKRSLDAIFGKYEGDFEMFFLSGVFLVTGSTMLIIQNTDLLLRGMNALGGLLRGKLASVKTAIAYPGASPMRTGMTVAMFCLIVFALVMTATMSTNFSSLFASSQAKAGWDIRTDAPTPTQPATSPPRSTRRVSTRAISPRSASPPVRALDLPSFGNQGRMTGNRSGWKG